MYLSERQSPLIGNFPSRLIGETHFGTLRRNIKYIWECKSLLNGYEPLFSAHFARHDQIISNNTHLHSLYFVKMIY